MPTPRTQVSERALVFIVGAIQFVNVLDFMMVMPLGPDFAAALGIATSDIGLVGGSYTASAAVSGVLGSFFLDRFDRRKALALAMLGLVLGTAAGGFSTGLETLLAARVVAGMFGGPATSLSLAVIADAVPAERRGKALGAVMSAFSVASVLGVPAGLELARLWGWRAPFFAVAGLGLLVTAIGTLILPPLRGHLERLERQRTQPRIPLFDSLTTLSLTNTAIVMLGVFSIVPNISAFLQHNLGYPREDLGMLYMVGGVASFAANRIVGPLVDRFGATRMVVVGTAVFMTATFFGFVHPLRHVPVLVVFSLFMLSATLRAVPLQTLASRVPRPEQRARFMSAQSAVQHLASALGAILASKLLDADPSGKLLGIEHVAIGAMALASAVPVVSFLVESRVRAREQLQHGVTTMA